MGLNPAYNFLMNFIVPASCLDACTSALGRKPDAFAGAARRWINTSGLTIHSCRDESVIVLGVSVVSLRPAVCAREKISYHPARHRLLRALCSSAHSLCSSFEAAILNARWQEKHLKNQLFSFPDTSAAFLVLLPSLLRHSYRLFPPHLLAPPSSFAL